MHVIDTAGPGGAETVFAQLVTHFARMSHEATIAVLPRADWLAARLRERGVEPILLDSRGSFNVRYLAALLRLASSRAVDIIHTHLLGSAIYGAAAGLLLRLPVVATFHGPTDFADCGKLVGLKRRLLLAGITRYVAVSRSTRDAMADFGLPAAKIVEIQNGIDTEAFVPGTDGVLRSELGIPDGHLLVGSVGNIRRPKAYDVLLRAAALVRESMPNVHFAVVGGGGDDLMTDLLALRRALDLEAHFHFLGLRTADTRLYQNFDLFVSSSHSEGLPMSFLEAMASGRPLVATASGGAEQVLGDGEFGMVVPPGSPGALAEAIVTALSNAELRARLAAAARRRVVSEYSFRATVERYAAAYDAVHGRAT